MIALNAPYRPNSVLRNAATARAPSPTETASRCGSCGTASGGRAIVRSNWSEPVAAPGIVTVATTVVVRVIGVAPAVRWNRNTPSTSVRPDAGPRVAPAAETSTCTPKTGTPCWSTTITRIGKVEPASMTLKSDRTSASSTTCGSIPPSIPGGSVARATLARATATKAKASTPSSASRAALITRLSPGPEATPAYLGRLVDLIVSYLGVYQKGLPENST